MTGIFFVIVFIIINSFVLFSLNNPDLLLGTEKYQTSSSNQVTTSSTSLVDDTEATLSFTLDQPCTVLIIYVEHEVYGGASLRWGNKAAIGIDGVDYSLGSPVAGKIPAMP